MNVKQLAEEMSKANQYDVMDIDHPKGEYLLSEDGYIEFYIQENAAEDWIVGHLYMEL